MQSAPYQQKRCDPCCCRLIHQSIWRAAVITASLAFVIIYRKVVRKRTQVDHRWNVFLDVGRHLGLLPFLPAKHARNAQLMVPSL